jgi:hypothetical protein
MRSETIRFFAEPMTLMVFFSGFTLMPRYVLITIEVHHTAATARAMRPSGRRSSHAGSVRGDFSLIRSTGPSWC